MADQEFERKIRDRLANYEEKPTESIWNNIEGKLPAEKQLMNKGLLAAATLLLLLTAGYFMFDNIFVTEQELVVDNKTDKKINGDILSDNSSKPAAQKPKNLKKEGKLIPVGETQPKKPEVNREINQRDNSAKTDRSKVTNLYAKEDNDAINYQSASYIPEYIASIAFHISNLKPGSFKIHPAEIITVTEEEKENTKEQNNGRLKAYFYGMPVLNFNRVEANKSDDIFISDIEKLPVISTDRIGFRLEAGFTYQLNRNFSLYSGIMYFKNNQKLNYSVRTVEEVYANQNDDVITYTPGYSHELRTHTSEIQNTGIHLGLLIQKKSNKFLQTIGTGVEYQVALNKTSAQSPNYLFYNLFYRVEYPRESKVRALFQPTFNYSLGTVNNQGAPLWVKPYGLGLNLGISLEL